MTSTAPAPAGSSTEGPLRGDIEGLRAVAVIAVMAYHAGVPGLAGGFVGVDVFFVISGFLITSQLLREATSRGTVSIPRFYARRAKRLLPAAGVTLVATALLCWAFVPRTRWQTWGGDIAASAGYVVNWRFANQATDYLAQDPNASVVQHFWSLAVEEQFYVVWPLLLFATAWVVRRLRLRPMPTFAGALAAIALPSLVYSVWITHHDALRAYFVTTSRLWELAIGGLVATGAATWTRVRPAAATQLAWLGMALIAVSILLIGGRVAWPGSAALAPTAGAALVILGGPRSGAAGPIRLLGGRAMRWIGGMSYSLYLWHWPLLAVVLVLRPDTTTAWRVAAVAAAVFPAYLTHRLVENPLRRSDLLARMPRLSLTVGLNFTLAGVAAGLLLVVPAATLDPGSPVTPDLDAAGGQAAPGPAPDATQPTPAAADGAPAGSTAASAPPAAAESVTAGAATDGTATSGTLMPMRIDRITPDPLAALRDVPPSNDTGCVVPFGVSEVRSCTMGDPAGTKVLAAIGDSKMAQWTPALDRAAREHGYRLRTYFKSSCAWNPALQTGPTQQAFPACRTWGRGVLAALLADPPDAIVTTTVKPKAMDDADGAPSLLVDGFVQYWTQLTGRGVPVVVLRDNPTPPWEVYECVAKHRANLPACIFPDNGGAGSPPLLAAAGAVRGTAVMSMNDLICPDGRHCLPVVGNVLVYRKGSHVTATFATAAAPQFSRRLAAAISQASASLRRAVADGGALGS